MQTDVNIDMRIDVRVEKCVASGAYYCWQPVVGLSPVRVGTTLGELRA